MFETVSPARLFPEAEKFKVPGVDVVRDFFELKTPKTRWNIEGRDDEGQRLPGFSEVESDASLFATDVRAAQLFHHWIPWSSKLALGSKFRLSSGNVVKARNFLNAALLSSVRHLDSGSFQEEELHRVVRKLGDRHSESLDVLKDVENLLVLQGDYAALKEQHNELIKELDPKRFFLEEDEEDSGEIMLSHDTLSRRGRKLSPEKQRKNRAGRLKIAEEELNSQLLLLKERLKKFTLPIRLLTAAVDLAHLENIWHAPPNIRQAYLRRLRYFHSPLLHRLGFHAENQHLQDFAMRVLNPSEYRWIRPKLDDLVQHHEPILRDLRRFTNRWFLESGKDGDVTGRPKGAYSTYSKMTEPADKDGLTGWDKYVGHVPRVHDTLGYMGTVKGSSPSDVAAFYRHVLEKLPGKRLGGFFVERVEPKLYHVYSPKPGTNYRAAHVIIHLRPRFDLPGQLQPQMIEWQLNNEAWEIQNKSGQAASHAEYKGLEQPPEEYDYVPPEHVEAAREIEVRGPDDGRERKLHPFQEDSVYKLLHFLGPQVLGHDQPVTHQALGGHVVVYDRDPEKNTGVKPLPLSKLIEDGKVYHIRRLPTPQPPTKQDLFSLKQTTDEPEWFQAAEKFIALRMKEKEKALDARRLSQATRKHRRR